MTGPLIPPGFAPTGRRVEIHGDDHCDSRGDLVCRCEAVYDLNGVGVQLGAVPAPGTGVERLAVLVQRLQARRLRRSAAGVTVPCFCLPWRGPPAPDRTRRALSTRRAWRPRLTADTCLPASRRPRTVASCAS